MTDGDAARVDHVQQPLCWERFLHKKTISVLLVETDDSTRQVVTALLRHCMYQVIPAENGQQAWKYLEDMQNRIDLVLTEVVMPGLSGISLLSRIMNHNICKNIPVIMMCSNDAMGTVFKCLSKGAVDFLVKPIRKNELKNLWQHVWRRCHSSSGSGSESGIQTQKCAKSKSGDESDNDSGSNADDEDVNMRLNARDGSDNSQAQSSWTKRAVEINSQQAMSPDQLADLPDSTCLQAIHPNSEICSNIWLPGRNNRNWTKRVVEIDSPQTAPPDQLADRPDSTCPQVIHPRSVVCSNRWLPDTNNRNCKKQKETKDDFKGKDLEISAPGNLNTEDQSSLTERSIKSTDRQCEYPPQNISEETMMENLEEPTARAADLIGSMSRNMDAQQAARATDAPNCSSKVLEGKDKKRGDVMPSLELSLKRSRSTGDGANAIQEEQRNVFRRSDLSAFTRYHTSAASNQGGTGMVGSCSPQDNSSEAVKPDSTCNMKSNSDAAGQIKQGSNGSSNNNDMGSTTKNVVTKPSTNKERVLSSGPSAFKANAHTSAFHPVQQWTSPGNATGKEKADVVVAKNANAAKIHFDVSLSREKGVSGAPQCGSSSMLGPPPVEGHAANYGVNSGSNNGSTTAATANVENRSGPGGCNGNGSGSGNDMYMKRERRVAAVTKFRQKRKERNFGKKVRYQSRKRLAEQRSRVRGQFVQEVAAADRIR